MVAFKVFDIEAYNWNSVYAIGIYDGIKVNTEVHNPSQDRLESNNSFIEWLLTNLNDGDIVYAHYGGRYDFLFIIDYVNTTKKARIVKFIIINGSVAQMIVRFNDKSIMFRDSAHILPASLLRLTNDFNVEHKKLSMNYDIGVRDANFIQYFNNDLMGLYEVLSKEEFLTDKLTLASNSMNSFIKDFYPNKMSINNIRIDNYFRESYYGGRTEVFRMKGEELNYYDVNSLYPYVMREFKYPLPIANNYVYSTELDSISDGIYNCTITAPKIHIPVLPVRLDGKLIFPYGTWTGTYASPELRLAIELGYDVKINSGFSFIESNYIFKDYVDYWYKIKSTSSGSKKAVAKLMLNSLYGKFGQQRVKTEYKLVNGKNIPEFSVVIGGFAFNLTERENKYSKFLHSEIASLITSYARVHLYRLMLRAGLDRIYYADTDSIITDYTMDVSDKLGEVKNEGYIKEFVALAPKLYAYIDSDGRSIVKSKGFNSSKLSFNMLKAALESKNYSHINTQKDGLTTFLRAVNKDSYTESYKLTRSFKTEYTKRIVNKDYSTEPLFLSG